MEYLTEVLGLLYGEGQRMESESVQNMRARPNGNANFVEISYFSFGRKRRWQKNERISSYIVLGTFGGGGVLCWGLAVVAVFVGSFGNAVPRLASVLDKRDHHST